MAVTDITTDLLPPKEAIRQDKRVGEGHQQKGQ